MDVQEGRTVKGLAQTHTESTVGMPTPCSLCGGSVLCPLSHCGHSRHCGYFRPGNSVLCIAEPCPPDVWDILPVGSVPCSHGWGWGSEISSAAAGLIVIVLMPRPSKCWLWVLLVISLFPDWDRLTLCVLRSGGQVGGSGSHNGMPLPEVHANSVHVSLAKASTVGMAEQDGHEG